MNSVLRHRSSSIISHYQGCLREAIRHGLLHDYEGNELVIYLLLRCRSNPVFLRPRQSTSTHRCTEDQIRWMKQLLGCILLT